MQRFESARRLHFFNESSRPHFDAFLNNTYVIKLVKSGGWPQDRTRRCNRMNIVCISNRTQNRIFRMIRSRQSLLVGLMVFVLAAPAYGQIVGDPARGRAVYLNSCVFCHGSDGKGNGPMAPLLPVKPADLTDCRITGEDSIGIAVGTIREGGPYQGISKVMPAFKGMLTEQQIADAASYAKSLCSDPDWVPVELNLPRPLLTDKAYPEQEVIIGSRFGRGKGDATDVFADAEYRLNGLTSVELDVHYLDLHPEGGQPASGLGDTDLAINRVVAFSAADRWLASVGLELSLPTGSESRGLGSGEVAWEPFVRAGWDWHQVVIQGDVILEFPQKTADVNSLIVYNLAVGRYFQPDPRLQITPMVELNSETSLDGPGRGDTKSAVLPQLRVLWLLWSIGIGVEVPITGPRDFDVRPMFDITYEYMPFW
jgi:mono/diheme cytochrome c family protein